MKQILLFFALLLPICAFSQFNENFSGSSVTSGNPWEGDVDKFEINPSKQLQFTSPKGWAGEANLSVPVPFSKNMTWEMDVKLDFKSTNANNLRVYAYSSESLTVYIQIGNNSGQISLYKQEWNRSPKPVIAGRKELLSDEPYTSVSVRLTLEEGNVWTLYTRKEGEETYTKEGNESFSIDEVPDRNRLRLQFRYIQTRISTYYIDNIQITCDENEPGEDISDIELLDIKQPDTNALQFIFDGAVDIRHASCHIEGIGYADRLTYGNAQSIVTAHFPTPLPTDKEYLLTWEGLYDSMGNPLPDFSVEIYFEEDGEDLEPSEPSEPEQPGNGVEAEPQEIIFNELLPEPYSGGSEYIELYNRSDHPVLLQGLAVAVRKADGMLGTAYPLPDAVLEKDGYILLTKDIAGVTARYSVYSSDALYELKLPVLANTSSTLALFRIKDEAVIDEVTYSSQWHAPAIKDRKGVALERINPDKSSQEVANWTSATSLSGYGTPGYKNSQYGNDEKEDGIHIETPTHNEDGYYSINYLLNSTGYSCRAYIYTINGKRVAEVANNDLLGHSGQLLWDGKAYGGARLRPGMYILFLELYNSQGNKKQFKKVFLIK